MFRKTLAALAAVVLVGASLMPDEAFARRGGGYRGGAVHARGGVGYGGRYGVAGRGYGYRPIPGRPIARTAVRRGVYRGVAYGAAAGAVAAGAYGYYGGHNNGCYRDGYGNTVCPQPYPY